MPVNDQESLQMIIKDPAVHEPQRLDGTSAALDSHTVGLLYGILWAQIIERISLLKIQLQDIRN